MNAVSDCGGTCDTTPCWDGANMTRPPTVLDSLPRAEAAPPQTALGDDDATVAVTVAGEDLAGNAYPLRGAWKGVA